MNKFEIIIASFLASICVYGQNIDQNIAFMKDIHTKNIYKTFDEDKVIKEQNKESFTLEDYSFAYLEFTGFPTRIEFNTFGVAIGYRTSDNENSGSDYSFHIMRNPCKEIILAGKANHLFYALEKKNLFSPYIGFGVIFGVAPEKEVLTKIEKQYADRVAHKMEYKTFVDGEIVAGVEYKVNKNTRQFFELTYYAHTEILQISIGLGF